MHLGYQLEARVAKGHDARSKYIPVLVVATEGVAGPARRGIDGHDGERDQAEHGGRNPKP
uniref:Uncharacterized protein n=1 Tax=Arundo donax TaxID=35708 RepID=A0A0A9E4E9_ARUDO